MSEKKTYKDPFHPLYVSSIAAAFSAAIRYTTPISWIVASQVLLTGVFMLTLRHLAEGEQVG